MVSPSNLRMPRKRKGSSGSSETASPFNHIQPIQRRRQQIECYKVCSKGWNFHITESRKKLLTENQGMLDRRESAEEVGAKTR
jgi:hypothetical protein